MESWFYNASLIFEIFSIFYFGSIIFYGKIKKISRRMSMIPGIKAFFLLSVFSFMAELFFALVCIFHDIFSTGFEIKIAINIFMILVVFYLWNRFSEMVKIDKKIEREFPNGD